MSPFRTRALAGAGRAGIFLCWCAALGCAHVIPPGAGPVSRAASERLAREANEAETANALTSLDVADRAPEDKRASRKASELAARALEHASDPEAKARLIRAAKPTVARLAASDVCVDAELAARVEEVASAYGAAANLRVRAAATCPTSASVVAAAWTLYKADRCPEAIQVVEQAWPNLPRDAWIPVMDEVARCSTSVSLRRNLAFVPADVREDYFALLDQRAEEERRRRATEALRNAVEQIRRENESRNLARRNTCGSYCSESQSQCQSSCATNAACSSYCASVYSSCMAGCQ